MSRKRAKRQQFSAIMKWWRKQPNREDNPDAWVMQALGEKCSARRMRESDRLSWRAEFVALPVNLSLDGYFSIGYQISTGGGPEPSLIVW